MSTLKNINRISYKRLKVKVTLTFKRHKVKSYKQF